MPEAMLRVPHDGLRIEADCTTEGHWADCRLHFGRPAMYRCHGVRDFCRPDGLQRQEPGGAAGSAAPQALGPDEGSL
eukprot:10982927-Alexandrium_andersonii.AAC.1